MKAKEDSRFFFIVRSRKIFFLGAGFAKLF